MKLAYRGHFGGKFAKISIFQSYQILVIDSSKESPLDADSKYRIHLMIEKSHGGARGSFMVITAIYREITARFENPDRWKIFFFRVLSSPERISVISKPRKKIYFPQTKKILV